MSRPLPPHYEVIAQLTREGYTVRQIADKLFFNPRTIQRARVATGTRQPVNQPMSPEILKQCEAVLKTGASYRAVARQFGISTTTVARHFPEYGWTHQQAGEYSRRVYLERRFHPYSREDRLATVKRMTLARFSQREIAVALGMSPNAKSSVRRMQQELQLAPSRIPRPWTAAELTLAEKLFDDGCSGKEVARTLSRPLTSVRKRFPGRSWTRKQARQFQADTSQAVKPKGMR